MPKFSVRGLWLALSRRLKAEDGIFTASSQPGYTDPMPPKPPLFPTSQEDYDAMVKVIGGEPDNWVDDATRGTVEGTPEPEDEAVREFFRSVLDAVGSESETPPSEDQGGAQEGADPTEPPPH